MAGTLATIGGEFVRIDGISATSITVGRGCLDTVPKTHPAGTPVICWQQMANATASQFASGETVGVKMLPQTGFGTLPLAQAPEDQVTLASRAIRPLPPGNFRGDGLFVQMLSGTEAALACYVCAVLFAMAPNHPTSRFQREQVHALDRWALLSA